MSSLVSRQNAYADSSDRSSTDGLRHPAADVAPYAVVGAT